jgi:hypothetical protein
MINYSNTLEPILELYRGKLYCHIIKLFINDCINTFGYKIFSVKKSVSRTLTNLLSSWILSMYIDYDYSGDSFFPNNYNNIEAIKDTLLDLSKHDNKLININDKIKFITNNLIRNYRYQLTLLSDYKCSQLFIYNKNNYNITKQIININSSDERKTFYKFNINTNIIIKDNRLINILNNILLPIDVYNKMVSNYTGPSSKVDVYIWAIIYRYQLLGSNNHQLGVLPEIMNKMKDDYNLSFECFASSINYTFPKYCSIYYDIEKFFGSQGNFFRFTPIEGTYSFNPPYQKHIINIGINKLFEYLDNDKTNNLTFIITIPIWDIEGQTLMKEQYNNNTLQPIGKTSSTVRSIINYGDFDIINKIKISKYFKGLRMIPKEEFTYLDHNFKLYKNKTIQNTYIIILSNKEIDLSYLNNYNFNL